MFDDYPSFEQFRPLSDLTPNPIKDSEDVFALQTALSGAGYPCGPHDGWLGPATGKAIWVFQADQKLLKDGIAGPASNNRLVEILVGPQTSLKRLPAGLLFGHLAHESSLYPGRCSPTRTDPDAIQSWQPDALKGTSFDAGVAQRNSAHTSLLDAFNTPLSIAALAKNERDFYDEFAGVDGRRRWLLAAGAWNAPAYARWIAKQEGATGVRTRDTKQPGPTARARIEAYMIAATVLMT